MVDGALNRLPGGLQGDSYAAFRTGKSGKLALNRLFDSAIRCTRQSGCAETNRGGFVQGSLGGESIGKQTRSKGADEGWPATGERQGRDPSSRPALLGAEEAFEYMEGVFRLRRGGRGRREGAGGGRGSVEERDANVARLGRRPGGGRE